MKVIKVINKRPGGNLFHYAHFICDCLFPEVINDIHENDIVIRNRSLDQSIGNFSSIYEEALECLNLELDDYQYERFKSEPLIIQRLPEHVSIQNFAKFRNFIFNKFKIDCRPNPSMPKVILIERGKTQNLLSDPTLIQINTNDSNGKDRREIYKIDEVRKSLNKKYKNDFKCLRLEDMSFTDQINHFFHAKIIVLAHGAAMSNLFFCNFEGDNIVLEVDAKTEKDKIIGAGTFPFFDDICGILKLTKHVVKNDGVDIFNHIKKLK